MSQRRYVGRLESSAASYPEQTSFLLEMPSPDQVRIFRVTPTVISVLDYSKGFGHTDLVTC
jgi:hypothetical protein